MGSTAAGLTIRALRKHYDEQFGRYLAEGARKDLFMCIEKSIRWEEQPLTSGADGRQRTGSTVVLGDTDATTTMLGEVAGDGTKSADGRRTLKQRMCKGLKILLPHIGLTVLLLSYIAGGAGVLMWLESAPEIARRTEKLDNITRLYKMIFQASYNACRNDINDLVRIQELLKPHLQELSMAHEYDDRFAWEDQLWTYDKTKLRSRWTFQAAVLYSLTVVTTTGYDHVSPLTDAGRLFAVFFGLVGIPLMFITAADIGKFLSEVVTRSYMKFVQLTRYVSRKFARVKNKSTTTLSANGSTTGADTKERARTTDDQKTSGLIDDPLYGLENGAMDDDNQSVQLPVFAYFGLILGYCAIGGLLFTSWETGPIWSFVHGFFFSFNTITTIGLGNVLVRNAVYLLLIVVYCIVGLAVITMCVDLASAQLKVLFTKLHYFGRKFRGARSTFMTMSDDIREAIRIIAALKKSRPSKGSFTLEDIKQFLEIEQQFMARPYIPKNIHFIRWMDEDDGGSSSLRSNSLIGLAQQHSQASSPRQRDLIYQHRTPTRKQQRADIQINQSPIVADLDEYVHI